MRILLLSPIHADAVGALRQRYEVIDGVGRSLPDLAEAIASCQALVLRSGVALDAATLQDATELRLVVRAGSGTDNVALDVLRARGIELVRVPEPGAQAVAEMTVALVLALLRNLFTADATVRAGQWRKHDLEGRGLAGQRLGIVGCGSIGTAVGRLAGALGMEPTGCVEHPTPAAALRLATAGIRLAPLGEVLAANDIVSVHVPLTPGTRRLLDEAALRRMPPGAYLVNLSRGGVVDEQALRRVLCDGHLAGAALDVHEHEGAPMRSPLARVPNTVLTPHIGAATREAQAAIGRRVVAAIDNAAERLSVAHAVAR